MTEITYNVIQKSDNANVGITMFFTVSIRFTLLIETTSGSIGANRREAKLLRDLVIGICRTNSKPNESVLGLFIRCCRL